MLFSLAQLLILGLLVDWAFRKLTVPGLVGMLVLGVVLGPFVLGQIHPALLNASSDIRLMALIVILLRAGLELRRSDLVRSGGRVLLLAVVPAFFEGLAVTLFGPMFLGLSHLQSALLGTVLSAVSPAVVVTMMIYLMERDLGTDKGIPGVVLAAAAINVVFVIAVFSVLLGLLAGEQFSITWRLIGIPVSVMTGIGAGIIVGLFFVRTVRKFEPRVTKQVLALLALSVLIMQLEHLSHEWIPFAGLLAVMALGVIIVEQDEAMAGQLSSTLSKIWVFAEILLFTLVGAEVNIDVALAAGLAGAGLIGLGLLARSAGTWMCLIGSELNPGERGFVVVSLFPKATVQAAIGGGALTAMQAAGVDALPGEVILAVAVLSIALTAPLGAWAIALAGDRWLSAEAASENPSR